MIEPSRLEISEHLRRLLDHSSTREEAAAWAMSILSNDEIRIRDSVVLEGLKFLGSVDLTSTDRPYLYMETDFINELAKVNPK